MQQQKVACWSISPKSNFRSLHRSPCLSLVLHLSFLILCLPPWKRMSRKGDIQLLQTDDLDISLELEGIIPRSSFVAFMLEKGDRAHLFLGRYSIPNGWYACAASNAMMKD